MLGASKVIAAVQERSRIFKGNTPLPLPLANAALASAKILRRNHGLRARLNANTGRVKGRLLGADFPVLDNPSPIIALVPRLTRHVSSITGALLRAQIFPSLINYAGGPPHGYFRFAISSEHSTGQLDALAGVLIAAMRQIPS